MRLAIAIELSPDDAASRLGDHLPVPTAAPPDSRRAAERPLAEFVAQLAATCLQAPQTRACRCGDPAEAIEAYDAMSPSPAVPAGRSLSRAV